eukprot:365276-Chlamydomonas_euryale.AAC.9
MQAGVLLQSCNKPLVNGVVPTRERNQQPYTERLQWQPHRSKLPAVAQLRNASPLYTTALRAHGVHTSGVNVNNSVSAICRSPLV